MVRHIGTPRCTWRRFAVLLNALPREARYWRDVTAGASTWSATDHLVALLIDVTQVGNWQRAAAHFKGTPKRPDPVPRPGRAVKRGYTIEGLREAMAQFRDDDEVVIDVRS